MPRTKKNVQTYDLATLQPDELGALKQLVNEFIGKMESIENEILTLREDRKELLDEYREKLDCATLNAALKVLKIQSGVERRDTFDTFMEVLQDKA